MALPVKKNTMTPSMSSKKIAALKIKHKVLNSSSFFKVSLKSNNKELAVALQLEKERSRQLQKDIVYLQKQAESLCFELCSKNYKHKKLLLIMQNLRSNTVEHFDMVAELCSDSDLTILSEEVETLSGDNNKENLAVGSLTNQLPPPRPKTSEAFLCPVQKVTADLPEKNTCGNILQGADINNDNTNVEKRQVSSQCLQAPQTGRPRPSISFWDEVQRLSTNLSQSAFDSKSIPDPLLNSQQPAASVVSACKKPQPSLSEVVKETEPKHSNKQEKTVLLNTTMDMTLCTYTEIVTVETKARKTKSKKTKKEQASVSNVAKNPQVEIEAVSELREVQIATTAPLLQTDHHVPESIREPEVIELPSPKTQSKSVATSRIPKLTKPNAGNRTKTLKERRKSAKHKSPSNDIVHPALDDYFTDPKIRHSKASESATVPSEEDTSAEQPSSRITFRRSRARSRRMTSGIRKIFNVLPSHEIENGTSELEQVCNEAEVNHESAKENEMPEELPFCAEETAIPEFSSANKKAQRKTMQTAAKSVGNTPKSRSRGFVKSAIKDGATSKMASAVEVGAASQDVNPYSIDEVQEERSTVTDATSEVRLHSGSSPHGPCDEAFVEEVKTPSSCKRPWVATLDSEIPQEHLRIVESDDHAALPPPPPLDQEDTSDTEFQKPKKARRDETGRSSKKKSARREECGDRVNEGEKQRRRKKKKDKTGSHSNKDSRTELEACHHEEPSDALSLHGNHHPERIEKQTDDLQVFGLDSEPDGERADIFDKLFNSESSRESNVTRRKTGKTPKPHTLTETTRNQRETFVVYDGTSLDKPHALTETTMNLRETYVVYDGTSPDTVSRMPSLSQAHSLIMDTVDGNAGRGELGECLTDEMPPWLGMDVSTADTELGSVLATPWRETAHRKAVIRESPEAAAEASPAGRVLTSLTNTITTPDTETKGRSRRRNGAVVSYKEPKLNSKIRRGDKNTDCTFLSSPVFKDGKKKKKKKNQAATNSKMEKPILLDF